MIERVYSFAVFSWDWKEMEDTLCSCTGSPAWWEQITGFAEGGGVCRGCKGAKVNRTFDLTRSVAFPFRTPHHDGGINRSIENPLLETSRATRY